MSSDHRAVETTTTRAARLIPMPPLLPAGAVPAAETVEHGAQGDGSPVAGGPLASLALPLLP